MIETSNKTAGVIALILIFAINVVLAYAPPDIIDRTITSEKFTSQKTTIITSNATTNETTTVKNGSDEQSTAIENQSEQVDVNKTTEEMDREKREERIQDYKGIVHIASAFLGLFIVYDMFRPRNPPKKKEDKEEPTKTVINIGGDYIIGNGSTVDKRETNVQGGNGIFKSEITGDVPIRAKEFKYLCDAGVSPEAVKAELKKTFSEKDAARLANTFRIVQEIRSSYCNTDTKVKDLNKEFDLLKMYLTEKEFLDEVESIQRRINAELREVERLDEKHVEEVKDFCVKFTEMWIARFLR